jgi:hypothetical protein
MPAAVSFFTMAACLRNRRAAPGAAPQGTHEEDQKAQLNLDVSDLKADIANLKEQVATEKVRQQEDQQKMEKERYDGKLKGGYQSKPPLPRRPACAGATALMHHILPLQTAPL